MLIFEDQISYFIEDLWRKNGGGEDRLKEMHDFYEEIVIGMKAIHRNTLIALLHCKNFEEIAKNFTERERKKKPLQPDSIRKRSEKVMKTIKKYMEERFGRFS